MRSLILKMSCAISVAFGLTSGQAVASGVSDADAGTSALNSGEMDAAIAYLTRGIQSGDLSDELLAISYHHRGIAHQRQGDTARAILDYTNAMLRGALTDELRPRTLNNRAICFELLGDLEAALRDVNLAIQLRRDYADPYVNRASVLRKMAAYPQSLKDYQYALALSHPRPLQVYNGIAQTHEAAGNAPEALRYYRHALTIDAAFKPAIDKIAYLSSGRLLQVATADTRTAKPPPQNQPQTQRRVIETTTDTVDGAQPTSVLEVDAAPILRAAIVERSAPPITGAGFAQDRTPTPQYILRDGVQNSGRDLIFPARGPRGGPEQSSVTTAAVGTNILMAVTTPGLTGRAPQAAPSTPPASPLSTSTYGVQLGSYASAELAEQSWSTLSATTQSALAGLSPKIVAADVKRRGRVHRLVATGVSSKTEADNLCRNLRSKGQGCMVALPSDASVQVQR